jgi:hypothetical protein
MYEDTIYGFQDYLLCPTAAGVLEYESQIDPFLHVGAFDSDELSKTTISRPIHQPIFMDPNSVSADRNDVFDNGGEAPFDSGSEQL